jgi:hypothetical protein
MTHLEQIKQKLGISGIATTTSSRRKLGDEENKAANKREESELALTPEREQARPEVKGAQIDLVIDRADRIIGCMVLLPGPRKLA